MYNSDNFPGGWLFKVVPWIIAIGFFCILIYWGFVGYVAFKVASDPHTVAHNLGTIVHSFDEGYKGN